jgi:hypothetical protein
MTRVYMILTTDVTQACGIECSTCNAQFYFEAATEHTERFPDHTFTLIRLELA